MALDPVILAALIRDGIEEVTGNDMPPVAIGIWTAVAQAIADALGADRTQKYSGLDCVANNGTQGTGYDYNNGDGSFDQIGTTNAALLPLLVEDGQTISAISARVNSIAVGSVSMQLWRTAVGGGAATAVSSLVSSAGTGMQTLSLTGINEVVTSSLASYFVQFGLSVVSTGNKIFEISVEP